MFYLIKMAFRNINRNRRRSILAFTSVALAIAFVTFFRGFAGGLLGSGDARQIRSTFGTENGGPPSLCCNPRSRPVYHN